MSVSSFSSAAKPGVCLSTDRPDSPFDGQVIYETDTNRTLVYDNSAWVVIHDPTLMSYSGTGVTVTADAATIGGEYVTPYTGRRNLLYNGAMQVNQRGETASNLGTSTAYNTADRWLFRNSGNMGTWTNTTELDAPDGFEKSFKTTCVTADASPASGDLLAVQQRIEGADLQHLKWGTSNAEQVTLSFWVKSNVTGTYAVPLEQPISGGGFKYVTLEYTINSSATWERKVLTFPANTVATMHNTTGIGLTVWFLLGAHSFYTGGDPQDTWGDFQTSGKFGGDQVNLASAVGNYWQVTGVQLEVGDKATPFEHRSFGEEFALCKRYFETSYAYGTAFGTDQSSFPTIVDEVPFYAALGQTDGWGGMRATYTVTKRAAPTVTVYRPDGTQGSIQIVYGSIPSSTFTSPTVKGNMHGHMINTSNFATGSIIKVAYHYTASAEL